MAGQLRTLGYSIINTVTAPLQLFLDDRKTLISVEGSAVSIDVAEGHATEHAARHEIKGRRRRRMRI